MHFRNRSQGNGYRAHSMGGVASASRISPESSMRGHGVYNNESRSYSRAGFSRSQSRKFGRSQSPAPLPPQNGGGNGDIFMEAGKLAAEYLVSKGFLPADVLSEKLQNGTSKNNDTGRASVLSRLGEAVSDSVPSRRKYGDEYSNSTGSRSLKVRKRNGSFKNYGSESNREMRRSGSWSERSRSGFAEGDDDSDRVSQNSADNVVGGQGSDAVVDQRSSSERPKLGEDVGLKDDKKGSGKEAVEKDDKVVYQNAGKKDEKLLEDSKNDVAVVTSYDEVNLANEKSSDLLSFCRFVKIPTRTRSTMTVRVSRADTDPMILEGDAQKCEGEPSKESIAQFEGLPASTLSTNGSPHENNDSKVVDLDRQGESASEKKLVKGSSTSSPDKNLVKDCIHPDFDLITIMTKERGEKRALDEDITCLGNKRPRELDPTEDADPNPVVKRPDTEELMTSEDQPSIFPSDEKSLLDVTLYPTIKSELGMEYTEEKQILPASFKTCDLNLMEAAESNDTHDTVRETGKQPVSVNVELSMHSNSRASDIYGKRSIDVKNIEVIDLENDSVPAHRHLTNLDGRAENAFNGLHGFPSAAHNAAEIPDFLEGDGNGLVTSELMENDIPNCSSVTADVNGLNNDTGLNNDQEKLGDEDPIYMSLGELPSSFSRAWE